MAVLDGLPLIIYNAAQGLGGTAWDVTLTKAGAITKTATGGFTTAETEYTGRGFLEEYSDLARQQGGFGLTDRKITLFAYSFSADPAVGDVLTVESTDYEIVTAQRDPSESIWICRAR